MMSALQRKFLVRVANAYHTASTALLQVIIGVIPLEILTEKRAYLYTIDCIVDTEVRVSELLKSVNWQQKWSYNGLKR